MLARRRTHADLPHPGEARTGDVSGGWLRRAARCGWAQSSALPAWCSPRGLSKTPAAGRSRSTELIARATPTVDLVVAGVCPGSWLRPSGRRRSGWVVQLRYLAGRERSGVQDARRPGVWRSCARSGAVRVLRVPHGRSVIDERVARWCIPRIGGSATRGVRQHGGVDGRDCAPVTLALGWSRVACPVRSRSRLGCRWCRCRRWLCWRLRRGWPGCKRGSVYPRACASSRCSSCTAASTADALGGVTPRDQRALACATWAYGACLVHLYDAERRAFGWPLERKTASVAT